MPRQGSACCGAPHSKQFRGSFRRSLFHADFPAQYSRLPPQTEAHAWHRSYRRRRAIQRRWDEGPAQSTELRSHTGVGPCGVGLPCPHWINLYGRAADRKGRITRASWKPSSLEPFIHLCLAPVRPSQLVRRTVSRVLGSAASSAHHMHLVIGNCGVPQPVFAVNQFTDPHSKATTTISGGVFGFGEVIRSFPSSHP